MTYVVSITVTALLFLTLILLLSVKPSISNKITVGSIAIAGISGFFIYGYGYAVITDNVFLASLKALSAVCGSFVGRNEFSSISSVPIMQTLGMRIFCEFIRICALYATASAIITTIGREALKKLRLFLMRRGKINLIYGVNDDSLAFGNELARKKQGVIVYISEKADSSKDISGMGCVLKTDIHAVNADRKFLKSIGFYRGHRDLTLYALNKNSTANIRYAKSLLDTLKESDIPSERLRLIVLAQEEVAASYLQKSANSYGYGFVTTVNEPQMVSRLLMLKYPPCNTVSFDNSGRATENFEALIIGFGQVGQAVVKSVVMNGQFEGSKFSLSVFASNCNSTDGRFADQLDSLYKNYDITFYGYDARSRKMYEYLSEHRDTLKYVVVCTGKEDLNHEISVDMVDYFRRYGLNIPVYKCSRKGVESYASDGSVLASHNIYKCDLICSDDLDKMAMIINHKYQSSSKQTALENWMECDYFSRQSCRASADFIPAMVRSVGKTMEEVISGDWNLTELQKNNLSKTEHLRWCAFHYCMGFSSMTNEEFEERAEMYRQQLAKDGKSTIRISKNMNTFTHACLVDWDELKILSEKEAEVTGKYRDYQAMDTDNVMLVPDILKATSELI